MGKLNNLKENVDIIDFDEDEDSPIKMDKLEGL
jgi:hypothetical protein